MDKIKPYLELLKKHHFWLLAVIVVALSAFAWRSGSSAYDAALQSNRSKIRSATNSVDQIRNTPNPPNATFAEGLQGLKQEQTQSTLAAWQTLYDRQKEVLRWSIKHDQLAALGSEDEIPTAIRNEYMEYFARPTSDYWPKLFDIVDPLRLEEKPDSQNQRGTQQPQQRSGFGRPLGNLSMTDRRGTQSSTPGSGRSGTKVEEPKQLGIVEWSPNERDAIRARYEWRVTPTNTQVRIAQEDYWIYKTLFEIIANTNKSAGATRNSNAAIKKIEALAIAQAAASPYRPTLESVPNEVVPTVDSASIPKIPAPGASDEDLLAGRYATETSSGTSGSGGDEFKLIPVLMRFRMDERRIPNLLVACANSPLPVKVQQVLYNPSATTRTSGSSASSGPGRTLNSSGAPAPTATSAGSSSSRTGSERYDATVELRGVVYMFNPPSKTALGLPEEAPAESAAPDEFSQPPLPADEPAAEPPVEADEQPAPEPTDEAPVAADDEAAEELPPDDVPGDSELPPDAPADEPPPQP